MSTTLIVVASATPATVLGALAMLVPALRMRTKAAIELVAADAAVAKAEELLVEHERTRNLPWYWPTGPVQPPKDETLVGVLEAVHVEPEPQPLAIADQPHHDDEDAPSDDTERPYLWALVAAAIVLAPYAFARKQLGALVAYVRERWLMSDKVRDAEFRQWCETPDGAPALSAAAVNPRPYVGRRARDEHADRDLNYRSRHTAAGFETGIFPAINATIPAPRKAAE